MDKIRVTFKDGTIYVLWDEAGLIKGTTEENYISRIRNVRQVNTFPDFTMDEAVEYVKKYFDR